MLRVTPDFCGLLTSSGTPTISTFGGACFFGGSNACAGCQPAFRFRDLRLPVSEATRETTGWPLSAEGGRDGAVTRRRDTGGLPGDSISGTCAWAMGDLVTVAFGRGAVEDAEESFVAEGGAVVDAEDNFVGGSGAAVGVGDARTGACAVLGPGCTAALAGDEEGEAEMTGVTVFTDSRAEDAFDAIEVFAARTETGDSGSGRSAATAGTGAAVGEVSSRVS